MKNLRYKGPQGEVEIKGPAPLRLVDSSWALTGWTLGFIIWGAYYLIAADPSVFLGSALSPSHRQLKSECFTCHLPFHGVTDESCQSAPCHLDLEKTNLHDAVSPCASCHREHSDGVLLTTNMTGDDCNHCHDSLRKDARTIFFASKTERRSTFVKSNVFKHKEHSRKCWLCHCTGEGTAQTIDRDLPTMKSCLSCKDTHPENKCAICHERFHDPREEIPRPRHKECISTEHPLFEDLLRGERACYLRGLEPAAEDIKVCETGDTFLDYGKSREENPAEQEPPTGPDGGP